MIEEIIADFEACDDATEQFELLMELGDEADPLDDQWKTEEFRVQGCTSNVWLMVKPSESNPSGIQFVADSDSHLVRGLATLLIHFVTPLDLDQIAQYDFVAQFDKLGLARHLGQARSNGLRSMAERIKSLAKLTE